MWQRYQVIYFRRGNIAHLSPYHLSLSTRPQRCMLDTGTAGVQFTMIDNSRLLKLTSLSFLQSSTLLLLLLLLSLLLISPYTSSSSSLPPPLPTPHLSFSPSDQKSSRRMSCLDEVPFKTLLGSLEGPREEVELITGPDITVPDYLTILQETEVCVCKRLRIEYTSPPFTCITPHYH